MKNLTLSKFNHLPKAEDGRAAIYIGEDEYERMKACVDACKCVINDDLEYVASKGGWGSLSVEYQAVMAASESDRNDLQAKLDESAMLNGSLERQLADYRTSYEIARDHALKQDDQIQALTKFVRDFTAFMDSTRDFPTLTEEMHQLAVFADRARKLQASNND